PFLGAGVQVYGNVVRWVSLWDTLPTNGVDPDTGWPILDEGQTITGTILNNGPVGLSDPYFSRERAGQVDIHPHYDTAARGTGGWRMGFGYRTTAVRGKCHVVYDYREGRSDGDATVAPAGGQRTGTQVKAWGLSSATTPVGGLNGHNVYNYVLFDTDAD